jgi:ion channel-forming bestrophin family protein
MVTAYILFGLLHISYQVENPFGYDWNDLDLDRFCRNIAIDLDLIASYMPPADPNVWLFNPKNVPLWPLPNGLTFAEAEHTPLDAVKDRLDERQKTVMECWERGLQLWDEQREWACSLFRTPPRPTVGAEIPSPVNARSPV